MSRFLTRVAFGGGQPIAGIVAQGPAATIDNTLSNSMLTGAQVQGFVAAANALAARINALFPPAPTPTVNLSGAISRAEGNGGANLYVFTITRSTSSGAVSVPWTFAAGSTNAADYTGGTLPTGGSASIADGQTTGTITISVQGDTTVEPDEMFAVSITAPAGYAAGSNMSATGAILNDDSATAPGAFFDFGPLNAGDSLPAGLTSTAGTHNIVSNTSYGGSSVLQIEDDSNISIDASTGHNTTWRVTLSFSATGGGGLSVVPAGFGNGGFLYFAAGNTFWWSDTSGIVNANVGLPATLCWGEFTCTDPTTGAMEFRTWAFGGSRPSSPSATRNYGRSLDGTIILLAGGGSIIGSIRYETGI